MKKSFLFVSFVIFISLAIGCNKNATKVPSETPSEETFKKIEMVTNKGTIVLKLYNKTPYHRDNFLNLAKNKAFDSLLFHRVISTFMIQAGDPDSRTATKNDTLGEGDAPYTVKAEFHDSLFHKKGVLAAARDNNPERASSAMQFYIVQGKVFNDSLLLLAEERINKGKAIRDYKKNGAYISLIDSLDSAMNKPDYQKYYAIQDSIWNIAKKDSTFIRYTIPEYQRTIYKTEGGTPHLDQNYTVFGEVIEGLHVVDSIASVSTNALDRPKKDVRILTTKLLQ